MDIQTYQSEALLTASPQFHEDKVDAIELDAALNDFIEAGDLLDRCKKSLFYGKTAPDDDLRTFFILEKPMNMTADYPANVDMLHGLVGAVSEASELAELVQKELAGKVVTREDIIDELGDAMWYIALAANSVGSSLDEVTTMNNRKLRTRFPKGFDQSRAQAPDKDHERSQM